MARPADRSARRLRFKPSPAEHPEFLQTVEQPGEQLTRHPPDWFEGRHTIAVHCVQQEQKFFTDDRLVGGRMIGQGGEARAAVTEGMRVFGLIWRISRRRRLQAAPAESSAGLWMGLPVVGGWEYPRERATELHRCSPALALSIEEGQTWLPQQLKDVGTGAGTPVPTTRHFRASRKPERKASYETVPSRGSVL